MGLLLRKPKPNQKEFRALKEPYKPSQGTKEK
jgi:hypothetical protein